MNSMFGKHVEPLSSSERLKQKRNLEIYKSLVNSSNKKLETVCLDDKNNIKNAVNYESYMNVVNGFYECIKTNPVCNNKSEKNNCFNVYLKDNTSTFKINTFDDVNNSFIDFENADVVYDASENGIGEAENWNATNNVFDDDTTTDDKGFVVSAVKDLSGEAGSTFFQTGIIEKASKIIFPYEKRGPCAKLVIPKLTFFDPSGNSGGVIARDIKHFFPMSKLSKYEDMCGT